MDNKDKAKKYKTAEAEVMTKLETTNGLESPIDNTPQNLLDVVAVLFLRRKFIAVVCVGAGLLTAGISLLMPNYYKAITVFYPASPSLVDPNRVYGESDNGIEYFGSEDEVDQLLAAANSVQLLDKIVKDFDLYAHYEIDSLHPKSKHKVRKRLLKLYNVVKNDNGAIEVAVEDRDREKAAAMANGIRNTINTIHQSFIKANQSVVINALDQTISQRNERMRGLSDSLTRLRGRYGIYDIKAQGEFLASYVPKTQVALESSKTKLVFFQTANQQDSVRKYKALVAALSRQYTLLTEGDTTTNSLSLKSFNEGKEKIQLLEAMTEQLADDIALQQEVISRYQAIANANVASVVGVEVADVPVVKSRPVRSLLVIGAGLFAFVCCVFGVLLFESYRHVNWKAVFHVD